MTLQKHIYTYGRQRIEFLFPAIVFLAAALAWAPILMAGFVNDDFQLLLYHQPQSFGQIFAPFYDTGVTDIFWRPVPNFLHSATMHLFGFDAFWFRLTNILLLAATSAAFYIFLIKINISKNAALFAGLLFAAAPSREIVAGWIAARGDILALLFMLVAAIYYIRWRQRMRQPEVIFAIIAYLLAVFSKEIAFAAVGIPIILEFLFDKKERAWKTAFSAAGIATLAIIFFLIMRWIVTGSMLAPPPNYQDFDTITSIRNFFIYMPLAFLSAETLEHMTSAAYWTSAPALGIFMTLAALAAIRPIRLMDKQERLLAAAGFLWFAIFALPAAPMLMRWYAFVPSAGIFLVFAAIMNSSIRRNGRRFWIAAAILVVGFAVTSFRHSMEWPDASRSVTRSLNSLKLMNLKSDTLRIWGAPDKIDRVNAFKIGLEQAVEYAVGRDVEALSPLRMELSEDSQIRLKLSENFAEYLITNGRFVQSGMPSTSLIHAEEFEISREDWDAEISNYIEINEDSTTSRAIIRFARPVDSTDIFYLKDRFVRGDRYLK